GGRGRLTAATSATTPLAPGPLVERTRTHGRAPTGVCRSTEGESDTGYAQRTVHETAAPGWFPAPPAGILRRGRPPRADRPGGDLAVHPAEAPPRAHRRNGGSRWE